MADAVQDDFGATVVEFYWAVNLDDLPLEVPNIANILKVSREDHDGKWARHLIRAEIHEVHAFRADFHPQDFAGYALSLSDVATCLADSDAIRGECRCRKHEP